MMGGYGETLPSLVRWFEERGGRRGLVGQCRQCRAGHKIQRLKVDVQFTSNMVQVVCVGSLASDVQTLVCATYI